MTNSPSPIINLSKYPTHLPSKLTSHQLQTLSGNIHQLAAQVTSASIASRPDLIAVRNAIETVGLARDQLRTAHNLSRRKSTTDARAIGPIEDDREGRNGEAISQLRRDTFMRRRSQYRRFKAQVNWHLNNPDIERDEDGRILDADFEADYKAASKLANLMNKRIDGFENMSYSESDAEFNYLIGHIEKDPLALPALDHLRLTKLFQLIKTHHTRLEELAHDMASVKARRAKMPKVQPSSRQLRQAVHVLLTLMNFDLQNGDSTYQKIMGQISKLIGSSGSVGEMRETRKENKKAQNGNGKEKEEDENRQQASQIADASANNTPQRKEGQRHETQTLTTNSKHSLSEKRTCTSDRTGDDPPPEIKASYVPTIFSLNGRHAFTDSLGITAVTVEKKKKTSPSSLSRSLEIQSTH